MFSFGLGRARCDPFLCVRTLVRYNVSNMVRSKSVRLEPSERTKIAVWAAAAGRCTFCNRSVLENLDLGLEVPIGELAHNVGWGEKSPRGESDLDAEQRRQAENLILLCRNCHKPIDDNGILGLYTVDVLARLKREHEQRVRALTEIEGNRQAAIVRVVSPVRDVNPELSYETVLGATAAAGYFPKILPWSYSAEHELDLRRGGDFRTAADFARCAEDIDGLVRRIDDGIAREAITRLAVFAMTRIPLLVHLGAKLDDKVPTIIFQRHRVDDSNPWRWPADPPPPPLFETRVLQHGSDSRHVALTINLSGTVRPEELPATIDETYTIYALGPVAPDEPGPSLISSPAALANFEATIRRFLARVEADHGKIDQISLFPAAPLSAAITVGRVLMPNVSPAWTIFDRDEHGQFFHALEVRR